MITRLEATRDRCFARLGIDVGEFHVLVGANGSGKTTLIDIPALLGELLRTDNIASVFTMKRGEHPPRASALRELVCAARGDDFSLAIEARMPWRALQAVKPPRPKEAAEWVLRQTRRPRSSSIYQQLAAEISIRGCSDPALRAMRAQLHDWFPGGGAE